MIVVKESGLPHEYLIATAVYVTVRHAVLAHGLRRRRSPARYARAAARPAAKRAALEAY
jgi:hypothetical protein